MYRYKVYVSLQNPDKYNIVYSSVLFKNIVTF